MERPSKGKVLRDLNIFSNVNESDFSGAENSSYKGQ